MRLRVQIQGLVPEPTERAFDFTSFDIVSGPAPGHGTLQVNTTPPLAWLYVDGIFRGFTPESVLLRTGWHDVLIRKAGYQDHSTQVYIQAGRTRTLNVTLIPVAPPNQPPVAQFTFSPASPRPGQWVQFDASASSDPDGVIVSYQWDFDGDGVFDASGQVVYYRFSVGGSYPVTLQVTDDQGATGRQTKTVAVTVPNQLPVASFTFSPALPSVGQLVTFNATASYDPDGTIVSYQWDLNGDGLVDRSGPITTWTYSMPGSYWVTLTVGDDQGAIGQAQREVQVGPAGPPGMPPMDGIPGIYVWGTDTWNITVNGSPSWTMSHAYRLELRTDGAFVGVSAEAGPAPLGLVPEPVSEGWRLVFEDSVVSDRVTYTFRVTGATSIYMDLRLDMDGDGALDRSTGFVHLRQFMVNPPNSPFVVGSPEGYDGPFVPSLNFRIGTALAYTEYSRIVFWQTTIGALEGR
jgi:PKD repeat protein